MALAQLQHRHWQNGSAVPIALIRHQAADSTFYALTIDFAWKIQDVCHTVLQKQERHSFAPQFFVLFRRHQEAQVLGIRPKLELKNWNPEDERNQLT